MSRLIVLALFFVSTAMATYQTPRDIATEINGKQMLLYNLGLWTPLLEELYSQDAVVMNDKGAVLANGHEQILQRIVKSSGYIYEIKVHSAYSIAPNTIEALTTILHKNYHTGDENRFYHNQRILHGKIVKVTVSH